MTFSEKIQRLRKENHLSQEQLATKLNVSRQAISKWEMGTLPDISNLVKISQFFDCSLDYLINNEKESNRNIVYSKKQEDKNKKIFNMLSITGISLSLFMIIMLSIISVIFPAPLTHQLEDGSWRYGLMGFIEYHSIEILLYIIFYMYIIGVTIYFILPLITNKTFSKRYFLYSVFAYLFALSGWISFFYELVTSSIVFYDFQSVTLWVVYFVCAVIIIFLLRKNGRNL